MTRLAAALKEWRSWERKCAASVKNGTAFLQDAATGELLLHQGRPALSFTFGEAWKARRELERIAAEQGATPPPLGTSSEYLEWPSLEPMAEYFLVLMDEPWSQMKPEFFKHFEHQVSPRTITPIPE